MTDLNTMTITAQANHGEYGETSFTQKVSTDTTLGELMSSIRQMVLAMGYVEGSWNNVITELADEITHTARRRANDDIRSHFPDRRYRVPVTFFINADNEMTAREKIHRVLLEMEEHDQIPDYSIGDAIQLELF